MNSPLPHFDDTTTAHRQTGAVIWRETELFDAPQVPPIVVPPNVVPPIVVSGRPGPPDRSLRYAAIGLAFSLVAHLSLSAWLNWPSEPPLEAVSFAGRTQAIQIEATFVEPAAESPPEPIELEVEPPARSAPSFQVAELARQATESVELVPTDPLAQRKVLEATTTIELTRREVSPADTPPDPDLEPPPEPRPRTTRSRQPPPSVAAAPIPPGTLAEAPPEYSHNPPPRYPQTARNQNWQGTVLLRFTISATGQVEKVRVVRSSGYPILDQAAVEAVSQWRGVAAKRGGRPVASVEELPVVFTRD